jgi:hypothetical protein
MLREVLAGLGRASSPFADEVPRPDVVGTTTDVRAATITSTMDLTCVAPGLWSVRVQNPDTSSATLADAYTVEAGGGADLWSALVLPNGFFLGRVQTVYLQFGNRGINDARAVPIWLSFPDVLEFHVPFPVLPPPAQAGQVATDWTRVAIDAPIASPERRDSFPLLLPIIPAGSTNTLRLRLKSPDNPVNGPNGLTLHFAADVGAPYLQPDLPAAVVAGYVARAKEYATAAQHDRIPTGRHHRAVRADAARARRHRGRPSASRTPAIRRSTARLSS